MIRIFFIVASRPLTRLLIEGAPRLAFVHHEGVGYHDTVDTSALAARVTATFTTIAGAEAAVEGMKAMENLDVISVQEMHAQLARQPAAQPSAA